MQRVQLADFLRQRRERLSPADVGLPPDPGRRSPQLHRDDVAAIAGVSPAELAKLENGRGARPTPDTLAALARALRLDRESRDQLFRLAGVPQPEHGSEIDHVTPGLMRVVTNLADSAAMVINEVGDLLAQNAAAKALFGDASNLTGLHRSLIYRWFAVPTGRTMYPPEDHRERGLLFVSMLRAAYGEYGAVSRAGEIVHALLRDSSEFATMWASNEHAPEPSHIRRAVHPEFGQMTLDFQSLMDTRTRHRLLIFTAEPGSEDARRFAMVADLGARRFTPSRLDGD